MGKFNDKDAATALIARVGASRWEAVVYAKGYLDCLAGRPPREVARAMFKQGRNTLKNYTEVAGQLKSGGFLSLLEPRKRTGSAANPITNMFPATITEQRYLDAIDGLRGEVPGLQCVDERESGHTLVDFRLVQKDDEVPVNVKNAGTRFEKAEGLVGLKPNDCVPIPAYKAHAAIEAEPTLLYAVAVDYELVGKLTNSLPEILDGKESIVWELLTRHGGAGVRSAEDEFVFATTKKYWDDFQKLAEDTPFNVVSARKSVRILQTNPKRTPGIGLRAWGTGASAEVNVHLSIAEDMTPWDEVASRIKKDGLAGIVSAVNRRRTELVYDPEI